MKLILQAKLVSTSQIQKAYIEDKKKNRIEFGANNKEWYNGDYGFDSYDESKKGCLTNGLLENIYEQYSDIAGDKYYIPWVSIQKGQTVSLKVKMKGNGQTVKMQDADYTFFPDVFSKEVKQVSITCNSVLTENKKVELFVGNKVIGAINFYPNNIKRACIKCFYVSTSQKENINLQTDFELSKIQSWLYTAFHPLSIEINLSHESIILSKETLDAPYVKKIFSEEKVVNRNDISRNLLMQIIINEISIKKKIEQKNNDIFLFLTKFQCKVEENDKILYNNGISSYEKGVSLMFLGNSQCDPKVEIPHELMHCLGLKHTFDKENQLIYTQGSTKNYMDYNNNKKITYKWQWDIMRKSSRLD